jgi:uncharacterized MAPEG superfamily protein
MEYLPYIAITAAFALIYLPRMVVSREMKKLAGGYDNKQPRHQQAQLEGLGRRALGAHLNGFEAFAPFAAGVLAAVQRGVKIEIVAGLATAFVVVRGAYVMFYLGDRAGPRSLMWGLGMTCSGGLMLFAILGTRWP